MSEIKAFVHCKTCLENQTKDHLEIGLSDPSTLTVHCATCDQDVASFGLAEPVRMKCDCCDEDIGPGHVH